MVVRNAKGRSATYLKSEIDALADEMNRTKKDKYDVRQPFSWSGIQVEFIRLCGPMGLMADNLKKNLS